MSHTDSAMEPSEPGGSQEKKGQKRRSSRETNSIEISNLVSNFKTCCEKLKKSWLIPLTAIANDATQLKINIALMEKQMEEIKAAKLKKKNCY